jgi:hypothetical protein
MEKFKSLLESKNYLETARYIEAIDDTDLNTFRILGKELVDTFDGEKITFESEFYDFYIFVSSLIVFKVYSKHDKDLKCLMDVLFFFDLQPESIPKHLRF